MVIIFLLLCPQLPQGANTTYASGNETLLVAIGAATRHHVYGVNIPYVLRKFKWALSLDEPFGMLGPSGTIWNHTVEFYVTPLARFRP
jgi:hypothetical protein